MPRHYLVSLSVAALLALSPAASALEDEIEARLTQCGAVGLITQFMTAEPAREGNASAQSRYYDGFALLAQSIRLIGEVTECAPTFDDVYGGMLASAEQLRGALRQRQEEDASLDEIGQVLATYRAQCTELFGFDVMRSAQVRIAREGVGCGWSMGED